MIQIPQVDPEILNISDKGELNYWLSKFVVEVRKKNDPGNISCNTWQKILTSVQRKMLIYHYTKNQFSLDSIGYENS